MDIFTILTPGIYWILSIIWTYIFIFLIRKNAIRKKKNKVITILIIVLSINAFRTMIESFFFSLWSTSLSGFISPEFHRFLTKPEILILPKILNLIAALTIVFLLLRKWFPAEEHEREQLNSLIIESQKELKQNEMYLKLSQSIARIGHYILDVKTGVWTCSEMLEEIFGIDSSSPKNFETWIRLVHPDSRKEMEHYFKINILKEYKSFDKSYQIIRPRDGKTIWVQGLGKLEFDADGSVTKMFGTIQDITERKELEDRLFQTEKIEAIGQLAGGVAHDFNNQLAGIVAYADILKDQLSDNPRFVEFADNILLASKRAADLTSQLLAFARKGKFLSVPIDLHKIIPEIVHLLEHTFDKKIVIKQYLKAYNPVTLGDPSQIQNAIMNLAINARDAMPDGGELIFETDIVTLEKEYCMSLSYEIKPGSYIQLCVTDNGEGIDKEIIGKIFDPFFTTKEPGRGTGMGLSAVFGTVKNHGGALSVYSEVDHGTTMKMYLPLFTTDKSTSAVTTINAPITKGSARILLIDDEDFILDSASIMLERCGYNLFMCRNGEEAVTFYKENWKEIDMVILDMIMPVMDGKTCFRALKKINPGIKVLLSSGYSLDGKAQMLLDDGVMGFIQKPFRLAEISQKISEVLNSATTKGIEYE